MTHPALSSRKPAVALALQTFMARNLARRGEYAVLSVTHPLLGIPMEVGAHSTRLSPEQYAVLVDELCQLAFLCPHQSPRIRAIADELDIPEIKQYLGWMREADQNHTWHKEAA